MPISTMSRMSSPRPPRNPRFAEKVREAACKTSISARRGGSSVVVVRRFDGHRDVVRMALLQAGRGDLDELRVLELLDGGRACVAHRRAQAARELVDDG